MTKVLAQSQLAVLGRDTHRVCERLVVCVDASVEAATAVRAASRIAASFAATWAAVHVETAGARLSSPAERERVAEHLRLAQQLGGAAVQLSGENVADEILRYAREHGITRIVTAKPVPSWIKHFRDSLPREILGRGSDVDVYVVAAQDSDRPAAISGRERPRSWTGLSAAVVAVMLSTLIGLAFFERTHLPNIVMVFLLGIVAVSMRFGYVPALITAALSALALDLVFVPPYLELRVADPRHAITIAVLFVVGVAMSSLTQQVRAQATAAQKRENHTARLYAMSRDLARTLGLETMLGVSIRHLQDAFAAEVVVLLPQPSGELAAAVSGADIFEVAGPELRVATWVWQHAQDGGLGSEVFPRTESLFLPLLGSRGKLGVLGVRPRDARMLDDREQRRLLGTFAALLGSALEREQLAEVVQQAWVQNETEELRSSLLSSVSHDLRSPLGVITGAASALIEDEDKHLLQPVVRMDLLESVYEEADRLNRLVRNLLDMTRLAGGPLRPNKQWHPLDEVVGVALNRLEERLHGRRLSVVLPRALPPVPIDAILIEQLLINVLENAIKYTPSGTPIELTGTALEHCVELAISDRGPGVPLAERERIFEKFHRLRASRNAGGAGLGLAICRGIAEAHGGRIWVESRDGGGATFRLQLPLEAGPLPLDEAS